MGRQTGLAAVAVAIETQTLLPQWQQEQRRQSPEPRWEERRADTLLLSTRWAAAEPQQKAPPLVEMEGVVITRVEVEEIEEFSDMEGFEREGLYASRHAPVEGEEPVLVAGYLPQQMRRKGKDKKVEPMVLWVILKRPEVIQAEKAPTEARKKVVDKWKVEEVEKMKQWEEGKLSEEEWKVYREAVLPIKTATMDGDLEETATGQRIAHTVGMHALQDWWKRRQEGQRMVSDSAGKHPGRLSQQVPWQRQQLHLQQQQNPPESSWAQRTEAAAALPQTSQFQKVGRNGKTAKEASGLEPIKCSLSWDERMIVFEWAAGAVPITLAMALVVVAHVNIVLRKVAPTHLRTTQGKIAHWGRLSMMSQKGASATMLFHFKKEIIEAAWKVDRGIINVIANESWVELKFLLAYERYWHPEGLEELWLQIEAENEGVVIPLFSMRWMRAKWVIEDHYQQGKLPSSRASVVFKVPNKAAEQKLQSEMWVGATSSGPTPSSPTRWIPCTEGALHGAIRSSDATMWWQCVGFALETTSQRGTDVRS